MEDIILISAKSIDIKSIKDVLDKSYRLQDYQNKLGFVVTDNESYLILEPDQTVLNYYSQDELTIIRNYLGEPNFYIIRFKNVELLYKILNSLVNLKYIMVDDDHDHILLLSNFVSFLKLNSGLTWGEIISIADNSG